MNAAAGVNVGLDVPAEVLGPQVTGQGVQNVVGLLTKERFRVIIEEGRDANDSPEVFLSVNGRGYQIKRGYPVDIPPELIEVLDHAVIDKHIPVIDENSGVTTGSIIRQARRFPYTNMGRSIDADGNRLML